MRTNGSHNLVISAASVAWTLMIYPDAPLFGNSASISPYKKLDFVTVQVISVRFDWAGGQAI